MILFLFFYGETFVIANYESEKEQEISLLKTIGYSHLPNKRACTAIFSASIFPNERSY